MVAKEKRHGASTEEVLRFIRQSVEEGHGIPSTTAIQRHMGWRSGATDVLIRLVNWGHLRRIRFNGPVHERYELIPPRET